VTLRLATSSDDRAIAIRDRILPLLRQRGTVQVQRDTVRLTELRMGAWTFRLWTPFNEIGLDEASSPGYRHAVERQRAGAAMERTRGRSWREREQHRIVADGRPGHRSWHCAPG
jgi:hypothetical protein